MIPTNLDMDVLRTLVIATDLGGFGKAANRLGRTQSAISLQMKKLEEQVGQSLFRRNGRGVALTDVGDVLLGYARRIILMNDEALAAARGGMIGGTVRLGLPQDLAERWLPGVLSRFHGAHPLTHVEAQFGRSRDLREDVAQGALDLALSFGDIDQPEGGHEPLLRLPLAWIGQPGFVADPDGPLPLALLDAPCLFRQYGIGQLDEARKPWRVAFTSPSLSGLWAAVEAGLGVTLRTRLGVPGGLSILDARSGLPELATVPLLLHVSANGQSPAVERLKAILLESLSAVMPAEPIHEFH
jgi:DNA-binding transcriptional LysR family regulator